VQAEVAGGRTPGDAWNASMLPLTRAVRAHVHLVIARCFAEAVAALACAKQQAVLGRLAALFALHHISGDAAEWLESGALTGEHVRMHRSLTRAIR
jgi:hypothetical protein